MTQEELNQRIIDKILKAKSLMQTLTLSNPSMLALFSVFTLFTVMCIAVVANTVIYVFVRIDTIIKKLKSNIK